MREQDNFETRDAAATVEEAAEISGEEAAASDTGEALAQELRAEADEGDLDAAESRPEVKKLFTLNFFLPLEDYLDFYRIMNAANVQKSKKKMTIMGAVEIGGGLLLVLSGALGYSSATPLSWALLAVIFLLGFRSLFYYKFFYERALSKAVGREYQKNACLQEKMLIDFYPNKCVEHIQDKEVETYWHTIDSVKESEGLFLIMLEPRRCLLVPKSQIEPQIDAVEKFLAEMCENYEKPRYQV